jgi:signal peptidase I
VADNKQISATESTRKVSVGRWAWEWTKSIVIAFSLFLVIRTFLVEAFRIPTGSMENTLLVGDFLLVNKAVYGAQLPLTGKHLPTFKEPTRGDVVVFVPPHEPDKNYVKRLIGIPGDTLEMRNKILYLNGDPQPEPFVRHTDPNNDVYAPSMYWQCDYRPAAQQQADCRPTRDNWGPVVVPADRFMMLGDNRDDSEDSRYWGFVTRDAVKGKPLFIYYSFDSSTLRPFPWLTQIRWGRIGGTID